MYKLLLVALLSTQLFSSKSVIAIDKCELYNNMRHSKNTDKLTLDIDREYQVLDNKRGQYYIKTEHKSVQNRWVDQSCFSSKKPIAQKGSKQKSKEQQLLLALSWQNSFCETHRKVKECRGVKDGAYTNTRFGLHGLWPQPRTNLYCSVSYSDKKFDKSHQWYKLPKLNLSDTTRKELLSVMPGSASNLQKHEWIKHGTCYGKSADEYYSIAISLTKQFNSSKVGRFFGQNIGKSVKLEQVRFKMGESFGKGSGKKLELRCRGGLITEVWLHLGGSGDNLKTLLEGGKEIYSKCKEGRIDRVGFGVR
jgi:ribonuclease T2